MSNIHLAFVLEINTLFFGSKMDIIKFAIFSDFWGPQSNDGSRYRKIPWTCSLDYKSLLNFTCTTMKFHNRVHASIHPFYFCKQNRQNNIPKIWLSNGEFMNIMIIRRHVLLISYSVFFFIFCLGSIILIKGISFHWRERKGEGWTKMIMSFLNR